MSAITVDKLSYPLVGAPRHVAIIMDGNRRWARQRRLPGTVGHWKGASVITKLVRFAAEVGLEVLTLYSFSTENWSRPKEEVEELMKVFSAYLSKQTPFMKEESIRLETIGDLTKLPAQLQKKIAETKEATAKGTRLKLVLALNYGGRDEITRATTSIARKVKEGTLPLEEVTEELISQHLDTAPFGDPDLFIRTSGEQRLSNFLLWQLSYTEVYITKVLWPDFTEADMLDAIREFQKRNRRHGGT